MPNRKRLVECLLTAVFMIFLAQFVSAQNSGGAPSPSPSTDTASRLARLEQQTTEAKSSADNAWMLTSSALVLMMTGPGLALFYAGLVRKKNVLGTMMQSFALMAIITVLWGLFSYSFCFGTGNGFIGGFHNLFLSGVGSAPDGDYAATIPAQTFMVYQLMFAIITPGLIAGAFAERMKFSAMVAFTVLWSILVYDPMAHMVWGKGGLLNAALGEDFRPLISPAEPWFTSRPAFQLWFAPSTWASGSGTRKSRCLRTASFSASLGPVCCGWAGLDSMQAVRWLREAWPPARSSPHILPPPLRQSDGLLPSGFAMASPVSSAEFPGPLPGWWQLLQRPDS